ncbi:uncharacterized protein E0L32_010019 [Thyridium curvatum]|uniref:Zn(2)-C6 fungal-type domain-containing protein n=1 Tax=Thyridium curvatum TaxID=1093900 RepID=A0A507AHK2_9PEZI|nr:uncharacterized protein E0L32_010019 [Thyridium curvatum]TPX08532.1 hypothetical protein E0L32_010019 [Thyridium curvatum]
MTEVGSASAVAFGNDDQASGLRLQTSARKSGWSGRYPGMAKRPSLSAVLNQTRAVSPATAGGMETPESTSYPAGPAKRRRTHLACITCRDRKSRCDGLRPACSSCVRRKQADSCSYDQAAVASNRYIAALEDRIQRLERGNVRIPESPQGGSIPPSDAGATTSSRYGRSEVHDVVEHDRQERPSLSRSEPYGSASSLVESEGPYQVDGLATVMPTENNDNFTYGGSSTIAFLRQVGRAGRVSGYSTPRSRVLPLGDRTRRVSGLSETPSLPRRLLSKESGLASLPIRYRSDRYLGCYWEFVYPLFPLFYKPHFMATYEQLWMPRTSEPIETAEDTLFLCNLNLAFALGCQFCDDIDPRERLAMANQFFERSQQFMAFDFLASTEIAVVQWLLLMAVYSIRMAQNMGLHLECPRSPPACQVDAEIRRRVWHTAVVLDRLVAMTFGRHVMIAPESYTTPLPKEIDDEYLVEGGAGTQPPEKPSHMGLFVSACKLFEILHGILGTFYGPNSDPRHNDPPPSEQVLGDVLNFNRQLDTFLKQMPEHLNIWSGPRALALGNEPYIHLQQQVLCCRFLYTRILCLRPMLQIALHSRSRLQATTIDDSILKRCSDLCVETAYRLIDTIDKNLDTPYKSPGWHSVYFVFASATIILSSLKLGTGASSKSAFEESWESCMRILHHYRDRVPAAPRAIQVLGALRQQLESSNESSQSRQARDEPRFSALVSGDSISSSRMFGDLDESHLELGQLHLDGTNALYDTWFTQQLFGLDFVGGA